MLYYISIILIQFIFLILRFSLFHFVVCMVFMSSIESTSISTSRSTKSFSVQSNTTERQWVRLVGSVILLQTTTNLHLRPYLVLSFIIIVARSLWIWDFDSLPWKCSLLTHVDFLLLKFTPFCWWDISSRYFFTKRVMRKNF